MPLITEEIKEVKDVVLEQVDQPDMFKLGGRSEEHTSELQSPMYRMPSSA